MYKYKHTPLLLLALLTTTILASPFHLQPRDSAAALATCEAATHSYDKDILVYLFAQPHCGGWTMQKLLPTHELNEHASEGEAVCYGTTVDVKSAWYLNDAVRGFGCKMWDLPGCQGNELTVPADNADAKWDMRDFSRFAPGYWSGRVESVKCFRM